MYVGFTAATGNDRSSAHYLMGWSFRSCRDGLTADKWENRHFIPEVFEIGNWIYNDLENEQQSRLYGDDDLTKEEEEITKKMILVALWCIQSYPSNRPCMKRVVEMMEGSLDALEVPHMPVFQVPIAPLQESSTLSRDISWSKKLMGFLFISVICRGVL
ncbi:hypothetical protein YC2023_087848 [Brassica napus]